MISVIYGKKGSGKTKRIIDAANEAADNASGLILFLTDDDQSLGIKPSIRFVNISDYDVKSEEEFIGFVKGMLATNFDIQKVYVDGISRLLDLPADDIKPVFEVLEKFAKDVDFVTTVSADELPGYLKKYAVKY